MPKFIFCEQPSKEWFDARCGRITGSRICDVNNYLKSGKEGADRRNYRTEIICERLTGLVDENFVSQYMNAGTEREPYARSAYEQLRDVMVDTDVGFAIHPALAYSGASPDGLVGNDGLLEIKCPKTTTHITWMEAGIVPEEHREQMYWTMMCCEREWCDFVSYDPRMIDPKLGLFIARLPYDESIAEALQSEVVKFNAEVEATIARLKAR
jgi:putative phage-type endonuclease